MKNVYFTILLSLFFTLAIGQENGIRKIDVRGNKVAFKELIHASIYFEINGKVIYVDPWGDEALYSGLPKADAIMITDIHPDHYSVDNINRLMNENTFFLSSFTLLNG